MNNKEKGINNLRDNESAIRGALMSTMAYKENLHRIGAKTFSFDDSDKKIMQNTFNSVFTPVTFADGILSSKIENHMFAHKGYLPNQELVNTEFTYKNGVYAPGKRGSYGSMAGALITTSDDPDNPGKKILNVSFRGTDADEQATMKKYATQAYPDMEKYYHDNFIPLEYMIKAYAKNPENNISSIEASGHSLGGAMVHRFLDSLDKDKELNTVNKGVTFGSPGYLSRINSSVAPNLNDIKVLRACAIEDYSEDKNKGQLQKTIRMTAGAIAKMITMDEKDTKTTLVYGDFKATQKYNHLDVKQFAHDYDPVTNYGYLEKQRIGEVERLTDFYKADDYKKVESWTTSIAYHSAVTGKEYGEKFQGLYKNVDFRIPQTDYKSINYAVDVANKGLDFSKEVVTNSFVLAGLAVGAGKAIWKGDEGKKQAALQVEKLASIDSHSSNRYIKNLNIKLEDDNKRYGVTNEEVQKYGPVQMMYMQQKVNVVAEQKLQEDKVAQFLQPKEFNFLKSNSLQNLDSLDNFESFLNKVDAMSEKYAQSTNNDGVDYSPMTPLRRM